MKKIDFNDPGFKGFREGEDILVDTGILLGYLNEYDSWHSTVDKLFENHVFDEKKGIFLYINPCILNEITHLVNEGKPIKEYIKKHPSEIITKEQREAIANGTISAIQVLVENKILLPLEGNEEVILKQLKCCKELGAADAYNASLAAWYGISFLTIDNKLVINIENNLEELGGIDILYYTTSVHKDY